MTKRLGTAAMIVAGLCAGSALAQAVPRDPGVGPRALHAYRSTTQHALIACGSPFSPRRSPVPAAQAIGEFRACLVKARSVAALQFDVAVHGLDDSACVAALRDYQVAFDKALRGMEPLPGESPFAYEQRQAFLFHSMAHAWGRFEVAESSID